MNILAIDTTTKLLSVSLDFKGKVLFRERRIGYESSIYLLTEIDYLLKKLSAEPPEIELLAVNSGPGSFTGIRVGLTVVKTWAQLFRKKVYVSDSFNILFRQSLKKLKGKFFYLGVVIPSIKGEWFWAIYQNNGEFFKKPAVVKEKDLFAEIRYLGSKILVVGEKQPSLAKLNFILDFPRAKTIVELAKENQQKYVSAEEVFPAYFRPALAEEKR